MSSSKFSFCRKDYSTQSIIDSYSGHRAHDLGIKILLLIHDLTAIVMLNTQVYCSLCKNIFLCFSKVKFTMKDQLLNRNSFQRLIFSLIEDSFLCQHQVYMWRSLDLFSLEIYCNTNISLLQFSFTSHETLLACLNCLQL